MKSIGNEETFPADLTDRGLLGTEVVRLADRVAGRLRAASRAGRTVQLKVRYTDFRTITRSRTLEVPTDLAVDISRIARGLLDAVPVHRGIRLLGVSMQQLVDTSGSGTEPARRSGTEPHPASPTCSAHGAGTRPAATPFGSTEPDRRSGTEPAGALERSVDAVRARFGDDAVGPAATRVGTSAAVRENGDA